MKILIAYDGSEGSKYAIEDLRIAGLPGQDVESRVLTIAEYVFSADSIFYSDPQIPLATFTLERLKEMNTIARETAESTAEEGLTAVHKLFPEWKIESWARLSSPASTILEIAHDWKPDLIVMGSHGRSVFGRFFIGSVSMRVATEAGCSVRIVKQEPRKGLPKILVAFDGSPGSRAAIHTLVHRTWPQGTALHIVTVADVSLLASLDYVSFVGSDLSEFQKSGETHLEHLIHSIEIEMKKYFQTVTTSLTIGSPTHEIIKEAERVQADMIFVGSHSYAKVERLLLGSVSHGVSARAKVTVEIVR